MLYGSFGARARVSSRVAMVRRAERSDSNCCFGAVCAAVCGRRVSSGRLCPSPSSRYGSGPRRGSCVRRRGGGAATPRFSSAARPRGGDTLISFPSPTVRRRRGQRRRRTMANARASGWRWRVAAERLGRRRRRCVYYYSVYHCHPRHPRHPSPTTIAL